MFSDIRIQIIFQEINFYKALCPNFYVIIIKLRVEG